MTTTDSLKEAIKRLREGFMRDVRKYRALNKPMMKLYPYPSHINYLHPNSDHVRRIHARATAGIERFAKHPAIQRARMLNPPYKDAIRKQIKNQLWVKKFTAPIRQENTADIVDELYEIAAWLREGRWQNIKTAFNDMPTLGKIGWQAQLNVHRAKKMGQSSGDVLLSGRVAAQRAKLKHLLNQGVDRNEAMRRIRAAERAGLATAGGITAGIGGSLYAGNRAIDRFQANRQRRYQ